MIETADVLEAVRHTAGAVRQALLWWRDELWHLLPPRVRQALAADPIALQILLPHPGDADQTVAVQMSRNGRPAQSLQVADWRAALAWAAGQRRRWGPLLRVDLVLPAGACLIREREVPAASVGRIAEVLALELERVTPFYAEVVRQGWRRASGRAGAGGLLVEHVVAKRLLSDPVLVEARALKVPIAAVDVIDAAGSRLGLNLLERAEVPQSLTARFNWAIAIAATLLVIATGTTGLIVVQRQELALVRLETDLAAARKAALAVRKRQQEADDAFDRIARLRLRRTQDFRAVAVWEEVTRRLPDKAWLTDMRIEDDILWLDGYARSASELVGIVAQSPMFSGVALSAPVTRDTAKGGERFQLRMRIEKAQRAQTAGNGKGDG